ncbi:2438_t:CDS:2, partial [Racocetra persica]
MQESIEKRKNENEISNLVNISQEKPTKKLSRHARYNKKRRLGKEQISTLPMDHNLPIAPTIALTINDITFDPNRWKSIPLGPSDRIASKGVKSREKVFAEELLIETLVREAVLVNRVELSEILPNFLALINNEIIKVNYVTQVKSKTKNLNEQLWLSLGQWLGMEEPLTRSDIRQHLQYKWKKLKHAIEIRNYIELQNSSNIITSCISRKEKTQMIISARGNLRSLKGLVQFQYIVKPEYVTDMDGRTLIHLALLNNPKAVIQATDAVNYYYFHTLNNPSHHSDEFWKNFIEHFGAYTRNNLLLFTSSNTASSHNVAHQECVDILLRKLGPLSTSVNEFVQEFYGNLYEKLEKLVWGPFAPRLFGIFPMIAINYNTTSDYHWDEHDEPNSLCCLVALGEFEGGELCFPQLQIIVPLQPEQVVAFSSRLLLHGLNSRTTFFKPKKKQITIPPSSTDCRRGYISLISVTSEQISKKYDRIENYLYHTLEVYEKGLNRKHKKQIQIIDLLENLSYNYNNKASVKTHIDMINQESQTQDTILICSCDQTHRCPCFVYEDEINRRVKKEVNVLFQQLLEYNEKTFDKFMREITIEHEKRVNENKKLRYE